MSIVRGYRVVPVERRFISDFIEHWHYSGNMNGVKSQYCFGLYDCENLIGAAVFAQPATKGVDTAYSDSGALKVIELRRLCCIDETPKNTESYFIGKMMKWLKTNTPIDVVLAYSDLTHGHSGVIYQASNFEYRGRVAPIKVIDWNGRIYHDRSLRVKYKGNFKPFSLRLREAVANGEARWVQSGEKCIYTYRIKH